MARDHRATYRRRVEIARAAGYDSLREYDRAKRIARVESRGELPSQSEVRSRVQDARDRAALARRQVHDFGDQVNVSTTRAGRGEGVVLGRLDKHGTDPARLRVTLTDGRRVNVFGWGIKANKLAAGIRAGGTDWIADQVAHAYGAGQAAVQSYTVELSSTWGN